MSTSVVQRADQRRNPAWKVSRTTAAAAAGIAVFLAVAAISAALQPETYRSVRDTISVLAAQDAVFGELMVVGFLVLAAGMALLALGLWRSSSVWSARTAAVMFAVVAAATVVAGLARVRCNPAVDGCLASLVSDPSPSSEIHFRVAVFVFAPQILTALVLAWYHARGGRGGLAFVCAASGVAAFALIFAAEDLDTGAGGLLQRAFLVIAPLPALLTVARRT